MARRPGLMDAIFRVGGAALGSYRGAEAAEAEQARERAQAVEERRERWRKIDLDNAALAERQRAAQVGELLRSRDIEARKAQSAADAEREKNEAAALAAYRAGQLELGQGRLELDRRRPAGGAGAVPSWQQQELVRRITQYRSQGLDEVEAARRARLDLGMSVPSDALERAMADLIGQSMGGAPATPRGPSFSDVRSGSSSTARRPGRGPLDLRQP